jgi:GT2 family glycosyltransferase
MNTERTLRPISTVPGEAVVGPHAGARFASEPLVSICMSAYNVERFLAESLGSVLAQTYQKIEVILIDDGSADRTYEVAQALADDRVRCLRVPVNLGGYQAMNKVARMARGELVAVYHSDDYYEPQIVAKEVAYLQAHPEVGAVFCLAHFMDEQGHIFGGVSLPREFAGKQSLGYEGAFPFILRNKNVIFCCPTFMARREVLEAVGLFDPETYGIAADLEMWLRIARRFPVAILNERLMRYRVGKHQWSARDRHLRTEPERYFAVMDHFLEQDGWFKRLSPGDLAEYAFHRCDDDMFRAANLVVLGDLAGARELLEQPYPWRTLRNGIRRRKLRLLALRALLFAGLGLGATRPLAKILRHIGP